MHSHSESGHRPPDHKVTNYVISKICDVTQSEFARVPPRAPEPLNTGTLGTRLVYFNILCCLLHSLLCDLVSICHYTVSSCYVYKRIKVRLLLIKIK